MSIVSTPVLKKLREELHIVMTRTVVLASAARFHRPDDDVRGLVACLDPTAAQRAEAAELHARLRRWGGVVAALIRRYAIATPVPIEHLVESATTYVLLQRKTDPDVPVKAWRRALEEEWSRLGIELERVLDLCEESIPAAPSIASYAHVDIRIDDVRERTCRVSVGEDVEIAPLPFTHSELTAFLESSRSPRSGAAIDQIPALESFGRQLFSIVTHGPLAHAYTRALEDARARRARLCFRFDLANAGPLARAPWELLHDGDQFLAVQGPTAIARTLHCAGRFVGRREGQFRVLVTVSSPRDRRSLNTRKERELLENALGGLQLLGVVSIDFAPDGTLDTLRRMVARADEAGRPYRAWHFIGHGRLDEVHGRAELILTASDGNSHFVGGYELQALFGAHPALELVVLNACQSGLGRNEDVNAGLASTLMRCGAPAVAAMQFEISDAAALVFSEEFYGAFAQGVGVLAAVTEARRAIFCRSQGVEWMTPVLFLRTDPNGEPSEITADEEAW